MYDRKKGLANEGSGPWSLQLKRLQLRVSIGLEPTPHHSLISTKMQKELMGACEYRLVSEKSEDFY